MINWYDTSQTAQKNNHNILAVIIRTIICE